MSQSIRKHYRGSSGPIDGTVTANVVLDTQTIEASLDRSTWIVGSWLGSPGKSREFMFPLTDADIPAGAEALPVYVRVTGPGYAVIEKAGTLQIA